MTFIVIIVLKGILVDDAEGEVKNATKCHKLDDRPTATESNNVKGNVEFLVVKDLKQVYKASVSTVNYYIYFA